MQHLADPMGLPDIDSNHFLMRLVRTLSQNRSASARVIPLCFINLRTFRLSVSHGLQGVGRFSALTYRKNFAASVGREEF